MNKENSESSSLEKQGQVCEPNEAGMTYGDLKEQQEGNVLLLNAENKLAKAKAEMEEPRALSQLVNDISDKLNIDWAKVDNATCNSLIRLVKDGFVHIESSDSDKRSVILVKTGKEGKITKRHELIVLFFGEQKESKKEVQNEQKKSIVYVENNPEKQEQFEKLLNEWRNNYRERSIKDKAELFDALRFLNRGPNAKEELLSQPIRDFVIDLGVPENEVDVFINDLSRAWRKDLFAKTKEKIKNKKY